jgi:hypothetical protein
LFAYNQSDFLHQDDVKEVCALIAEHTQLFELHFCDLHNANVTKHLLVGDCDFSDLVGSQKYFYAQPVIITHFS